MVLGRRGEARGLLAAEARRGEQQAAAVGAARPKRPPPVQPQPSFPRAVPLLLQHRAT